MAALRVALLGGFALRAFSGEAIPVPGNKAALLLAYLALPPGKSHPRSRLIDLLWSDRSESQGRGSLRQLLWSVRRQLGEVKPCPLVGDGESVALDAAAVEVDALEFEHCVRCGTPEALSRAVAIYGGELLDGMDLGPSELAEQLVAERERLSAMALVAMTSLLEHQVSLDLRGAAIETARRVLSLDPLQEGVHAQLIQLFVEQGQHGLALAQYERCRSILERDLGIAPGPQVEAARRAIGRPRAAGPRDSQAPPRDIPQAVPGTRGNRARWARLALLGVAATALAAVVVGLALWRSLGPGILAEPEAALWLPDRPAIAVLPFADLSVGGQQQVYADGLTDDLISDLSKISGVFVIARDSSFAYRDRQDAIKDVASSLGVRYLVQGSVRRSRGIVRINAQLIDAATGQRLWAETYDRHKAELLAVQDEVIGHIVSALEVQLSSLEQRRLAQIPTENLEAYDTYLRAEQEGIHAADVETLQRALSFYRRASELDPDFAEAHAGYARTAAEILRQDYSTILTGGMARKVAYEAASRALKLDPFSARAHGVLAQLQLLDRRHDEAVASARRAVALQPSDASAQADLALVLAYSGEPEEAAVALDRALRLNPSAPPGLLIAAGIVYYTVRDYDRAIRALAGVQIALPRSETVREYLAAAYAQQGRTDLAVAEADALRASFPSANLAFYELFYDHYRRPENRSHLIDGLRKAGLTEWPFGFEGEGEDLVDAGKLPSLVLDRTWTGAHSSGTAFVQHVDREGRVAYRSDLSFLTGTVQLRRELLCHRFDGYFRDRAVCGRVYRNRAASSSALGDYVFVTPDALRYFSVSE